MTRQEKQVMVEALALLHMVVSDDVKIKNQLKIRLVGDNAEENKRYYELQQKWMKEHGEYKE